MELQKSIGEIPGPGCRVKISDSIELCIVELTRVDCSLKSLITSHFFR